MEVIEQIVNYIGSIGFPAVMSLLLWYYIRDNSKATTQAINELTNAINELKIRLEDKVETKN